MAITTLDGAIAGFQQPRFFFKAPTPTLVTGRPFSTWGLAGIPGAGAFDTTLNGVTLSSSSSNVAGQIPWTDPGTGNSYLARLVGCMHSNGGQLLLCDRLWHNGGYTITSTGAQSSTTPTWPARDNSGSTSGDGVLLGLEISAACGAAAPTITVSYTNSAGISGRTAGFVFPTGNSPAAGSFFPIALQSGDIGVQSVQSITLSASWVSGTINLVAYRVIADLCCPWQAGAQSIDLVTSGMPQIFNGAVPFIIGQSPFTTATSVSGCLTVTQG